MLFCFIVDRIGSLGHKSSFMDQESQAPVTGIEPTIHVRRSAGDMQKPHELICSSQPPIDHLRLPLSAKCALHAASLHFQN
ncbi:hypothetical protein CGRA01v4_10764 [Colletotrichum graminicola]|nr:hypothetical protein CGRA01v4_10764 [Colletotrichum graminicola]